MSARPTPKRRGRPSAHERPARERMLEATRVLLQRQGYGATGLAEILARSDAPRGSVYFHFPGGKEELACEALRASGQSEQGRLRAISDAAPSPREGIMKVCEALADELESSGFALGCPLATVALEASATSEPIRAVCAEHYESWEQVIAEQLRDAGIDAAVAEIAATAALASIEGAMLLCRVKKSRVPLERVAFALSAQLDMLSLHGPQRAR